MNRKGIVGLLILLVGCILSDAATRPASIQIAGKEYIRLADWGRARNLELRWIKRDETFQLSNPGCKMVFSIDSREATVNGVKLWLLFPLHLRNGAVYLAQLDAQTSLQPLISPPKNRPGDLIKTICLDPGHGGKDPGNRVGSYQEKKYTLLLAQEIREQLTRAGLKTTFTRTGDSFVELPDRPQSARRKSADLFVSLHFNAVAGSRSSVKGAEVYCLTPAGASSTNARGEGSGAGWFTGNRFNEKNMTLAYQLQKSLVRNLGAEDRGVRRARFAVLRDAAMPAVLVEGGFMSHPVEGKKIFDAAYRKQMAKAIVEGVLAYKRIVEQAG